MDVIDVVRKDHRRVEELFSRFRGGGAKQFDGPTPSGGPA